MSSHTIHVVFKTHLDIGFTKLAREVVEDYFEHFIPGALELARTTREQGGDRFVWTTGSWLIHEFLERKSRADRRAMEDAIMAGDIAWHALPFTTHTELMDASLFRHGLSLSQSLDARFGRRTIAAKMTDVPGHTRAMLPLFAEAGVKLLHIGVNGASTPPDVPPVFRWRNSDESEVVVIYERVYGGTRSVEGVNASLAFGHTNDNHGPQGEEEVSGLFDSLRQQFPEARVIGSTMDAFAEALVQAKPDLPVVESEIGDTWIHGVGTDPLKVAKFKALSRWRESIQAKEPSFATSRAFSKFSTNLSLVAEHTWGRDLKRWKKQDDGEWIGWVEPTYETAEFLKKRALGFYNDYEASWQEQREYLKAAVDALGHTPFSEEAHEVLASAGRCELDLSGCQPVPVREILRLGDYDVALHPESGAFSLLRLQGSDHDWAGDGPGLGRFRYQIFGEQDYERFYLSQYNKDVAGTDKWARPDFTKPGLGKTVPVGRGWDARLVETRHRRVGEIDELWLELGWNVEASRDFGAPAHIAVRYQFQKGSPDIHITIHLKGKQACRIAEALWWGFHPSHTTTGRTHLVKMGQEIAVGDIVGSGSRSLHACEAIVCTDSDGAALQLDFLSSALVAPGRPSLLDFHDGVPDIAKDGFHANLFNNVWGTNFPMWHDDDVALEFKLSHIKKPDANS
jgi:hypothetical protein